MSDSPWPTIHSERQALADDLADLAADRWSTPSLCSEWTVHQVLAHQTSTAKLTPLTFVGRFASARFNFKRLNDHGVSIEGAGGPEQTLADFRGQIDASTSPPGPVDSWLGETIVHAEDIRQPLGIKHEYPLAAVTRAILFYSNSNAIIGGKTRVAGLTLRATDTEFENGVGPLVEGPAMALLLATTGRKSALEELTGVGVDTLRAR